MEKKYNLFVELSSSMAKIADINSKQCLLILFSFWSQAAGTHILNQGDWFNTSASLVSRNQIFTLKFSNISSQGWYLSIWYKYDSKRPCWLANRDRPIESSSPILLIDEEGGLTLENTGGDPIKLYSSQSKTNVSATLQDNGNFVLTEETSGQILWQSFDYPTQSFLPGMKLGINHKTGHKWSLTSWLTDSIPSPGAFTLEWDHLEHQLVIHRRGLKFWTSGKFQVGAFENVNVFGDVFDYDFELHFDEDADYLTYDLVSLGGSDPGFINRVNVSSLSLEEDGTMIHHGSDSGYYPIYNGECDGTSTVPGCVRWEGPKCRRYGDAFVKKVAIIHGSVPRNVSLNASQTFSDCKDKCWNDCECVGVSVFGIGSLNPGCTLWYGPYQEIQIGAGGTISYIISGPPPPPGISLTLLWLFSCFASNVN